MNPAPFMHPWGSGDYGAGNEYEMRRYTYAPGATSRKCWRRGARRLRLARKFSSLAACWTSEARD